MVLNGLINGNLRKENAVDRLKYDPSLCKDFVKNNLAVVL